MKTVWYRLFTRVKSTNYFSTTYNVCSKYVMALTQDLHLEIMAKTVIPGYNVVGTSKCILSQAGRLSRLPFIAFKMRT